MSLQKEGAAGPDLKVFQSRRIRFVVRSHSGMVANDASRKTAGPWPMPHKAVLEAEFCWCAG